MQATQQLPQANEVSDFLTSLYGLKIVAKGASVNSAADVSAFAEYVDDEGTIRGFIGCDLAGSAKLGAALTQIPMGAVEDTLEAGTLPGNLSENLAEVFNIVVNLFPECHIHRLVLGRTVFGEAATAAFAEHSETASVVFELDIQRYGTGVLLLAAP